jgi:hypothetical protein
MNVIIENQDINLHGKISAPVVLCDTAITKKIVPENPVFDACHYLKVVPSINLQEYSLEIFLRCRNVFFRLG